MKKQIDKIVEIALREDIGSGDITTNCTIAKERKAKAVILAKEAGVVAGLRHEGAK